MAREISQTGLNLIQKFEGCSLTVYQDAVGVWTIGFGHTGADIDADTPPCTQDQASEWLADDLVAAETIVDDNITAPLNDNQFSALVSLAYNCGVAPFKGTLGTRLNAGDYGAASNEFLRWDHGGGEVIDGLTRRREAEKALFDTAC